MSSSPSLATLRFRLRAMLSKIPGLVFSSHRIAALGVFSFFISVSIYSAASIHHGNSPVQQIKDTASGAANGAANMFKHKQKPLTVNQAVLSLYESIRTNVSAPVYKAPNGQEYKISEHGRGGRSL